MKKTETAEAPETQTDVPPETPPPETPPPAQEVIAGPATLETTAVQQAQAARGGEEIVGDPYKVGEAIGGGKLYSGIVTVTSVSGEFDNSKISTRINVGPQPRGEHWLKYAFKRHFPSADTETLFEVDAENKSDPLLGTQFD